MSGRSNSQKKKEKGNKLVEELKDICPEHKRKDLDALCKKYKGDKEKIHGEIQNWWEEDNAPKEQEWEDVSKKSKKVASKYHSYRDRDRENGRGGGGRGNGRSGDRGGRGGYSRGPTGGRGGGPDRDRRNRDRESGRGRGEGRGGGGRKSPSSNAHSTSDPPAAKKEESFPGPSISKTPATARPLIGAWGERAAAVASTASDSPPSAPPAPAPVTPIEESISPVVDDDVVEVSANPVVPVAETTATEPPEKDIDVSVVVSHDPTPPVTVLENDTPSTTAKSAPAPTGGNVWATRGSAHLIQAEKKPVIPDPAPIVQEKIPVTNIPNSIDSPLLPDPVIEDQIISQSSNPPDTLDATLPASVNGANINAAGWKPLEPTPPPESVQASSVGPVSVNSSQSVVDPPHLESVPVSVEEEIVITTAPVSVPLTTTENVESSLKPTSVLNMGHWDNGEGEESVSHEFGFGSFGQENDVASVDETTISSTTNNVTAAPVQQQQQSDPVNVAASTVSPARPPPGLGLMRSMPDNIVHVHELENKFENVALTAQKEEEPKSVDPLPENVTQSAQNPAPTTVPPAGTEAIPLMQQPAAIPQQSYAAGQYGMNIYNYNAAQSGVGAPNPNAFMGVPGATPILSGTVPPQQKQQQGGTLPHQQGSLYGTPAPGNPSNETNATTDTTNPSTNAAIPPGVHGIPQYNPTLFYGQQHYQMGQPHGVSYGYGFPGQYGGIQAGFGYQQVMGQGAGYGQPYEDQTQHHNGNNQGAYNQKSGGGGGGGYRGGRNNHHNQYQNQYNPQGHNGYGQQTYNMGYNDHFNQQRAGYGPGNMDPYMQNSGGYHQENDHQIGKGKSKGNNRNNFGGNTQNMHHQYQQGGHQGGNQFSGGLQGGASDNTSANNSGLPSYQGWGGGGL